MTVVAAFAGVALVVAHEARPEDPVRTEGDLVVGAKLRRATVRLGEEIELDVTVTNRGSRAAPVPRLWIAGDAVALQLGWDGQPRAVIDRRRGTFRLDGEKLVFAPTPSPSKPLAAGAEVKATFRFAAVRVGEMTVRPLLRAGGADPLVGPVLELRVNPGRRGGKLPAVDVDTTAGPLRIELKPERAYNTVAAFWSLARTGFYDDLPFHRILTGSVVQTGDPTGTGAGHAGWYLPAEGVSDRLARGDVCLARGPHSDSSSSQWFAFAGKAPKQFESGFNSLGVVSQGLDTLETLAATKIDPDTGRPVKTPRVTSIKVVSP